MSSNFSSAFEYSACSVLFNIALVVSSNFSSVFEYSYSSVLFYTALVLVLNLSSAFVYTMLVRFYSIQRL